MADIRSSQNIAQVEWQEPGVVKTVQTIAQVEYDESVGAIMNQFQKSNVGADLYNGAIIA